MYAIMAAGVRSPLGGAGRYSMGKERPSLKSNQVQAVFVEAARALILREGMEALTIRRIAAEAGYTFASIYNHFEKLDELLWRTRARMVEDLARHLAAAGRLDAASTDDVVGVFLSYVDYFLERPHAYRFIYCHRLDASLKPPGLAAAADPLAAQLFRTFSYLYARGLRGPEELAAISSAIRFGVQGVLTLYLAGNEGMTAGQAREHARTIVLHALRD
jgi:AcrR family transcriptional regulator